MVKDVVKSECRMIDMWSCFQTVDALEKHSAGRKEMITMWSGKGCSDISSSAGVVL